MAGQGKEGHDKDGLNVFFKIIMPDHRDMVFKSCEGLESEIEVRSYYEGGSLAAPKTARGTQKVNKISFGQGTAASEGGSKSLFDWYLEVSDSTKALTKRTLSVVVSDAEGHQLAEWRILNAWPCRWMAPMMSQENSQVSVEIVSFAHEGIERKK